MFVDGQQRLDLVHEAATKVQDVKPSDPGFQAEAISRIGAVVDEFKKTAPLSPLVTAKLEAEIASGVVGTLSGLKNAAALKAQDAATLLNHCATIRNNEELILGRFGVTAPDQKPIAMPDDLVSALRAFSGLAGTYASPIAHDSYVRSSAADTVVGERSDDVGQYHKRAREHMLPFEVVLSQADSLEDNLLQNVLAMNKDGVDQTLQAIVDAGQNEVFRNKTGFKKAVMGQKDHFDGLRPRFNLSDDSIRYMHRLGAELKFLYEAAEHNPAGVPLSEYPMATAVLEGIHNRWLKDNWDWAGKDLQKPFKDLKPEDQIRNIPIMLASLHGVLAARDAIEDILERGVIRTGPAFGPDGAVSKSHPAAGEDSETPPGYVSDAGFGLQMHMVSSARASLAVNDVNTKLHTEANALNQKERTALEKDFNRRNEIHARAIADEAGVLTCFGAKMRDLDVLADVHGILFDIAAAAGREYLPGGKGAGGAQSAALDRVGDLLVALNPGVKMTAENAAKNGFEIFGRATVDDVAEVMTDVFGRPGVEERGKDLLKMFKKTVPKDDYFYDKIKDLPIRDKDHAGLNDDEKRTLAIIFRALNVGWKMQNHRVESNEEKGKRDYTRIMPGAREAVYNPYDLLISAGPEHQSLFVVVKDLIIGQEAIQERLAPKDANAKAS